MRRQRSLATLLTLAVLAAGLVGFAWGPKRAFSPQENRVLQQRPSFSLSRLLSGAYTQEVESYLADQFPLRDTWVQVKSGLWRLSGHSDHGGVYFGRDGYLLGIPAPTEPDVLARNLDILSALACRQGHTLPVLLVPSAASTLPDKLPPQAPVPDEAAVWAGLAQSPPPGLLLPDAFTPLQAAADTQQVYFRTDHHWNDAGAYVGYHTLMTALGRAPRPASDFVQRQVSASFQGTLAARSGDPWAGTDALRLWTLPSGPPITQEVLDDGTQRASPYWWERLQDKDQYTVYLGGNHAATVLRNPQGQGRLLLLKDSYAHILAPLLAADFEEVHLLDARYYLDNLDAYIAQNGITDVAALFSLETFGTQKLPLTWA